MTPCLDSLASAVIGGLFTLFGAVIAGCYALKVWQKQRRNDERSAGRALLVEMMNNTRVMISASHTAPVSYPDEDRYSTKTWQTQLPLVASLFDWNELESVALAYDAGLSFLSLAAAVQSQLAKAGEPFPIAQGMPENFCRAAKDFIKAIDLVKDKILGNLKCEVFQKQLQRLEKDLESACK